MSRSQEHSEVKDVIALMYERLQMLDMETELLRHRIDSVKDARANGKITEFSFNDYSEEEWQHMVQGQRETLYEIVQLSQQLIRSLEQKLDRRTAKPRYAERDAEIVRLRDVENKTFGQVAVLIRKNADWKRTQTGAPFNADAAKKAYARAKQQEEK